MKMLTKELRLDFINISQSDRFTQRSYTGLTYSPEAEPISKQRYLTVVIILH